MKKAYSQMVLLVLLCLAIKLGAQPGGLDRYYYHYPKQHKLYIRNLYLAEATPSCRILFGSDLRDVREIQISLDSGEYKSPHSLDSALKRSSSDKFLHYSTVPLSHEIIIKFSNKGGQNIIRKTLGVKMKSADENLSFSISFTYYSRSFYEASNLSLPGRIIINSDNLEMSSSSVSDWIAIDITNEDEKCVRRFWPNFKPSNNYDGARLILKKLLVELNASIGIPSDSLNMLHPLDQYERVVSGQEDFLWCTNIAAIFVYITNSLGIPSRYIATGKHIANMDVLLFTHDGHTTTEIYDNASRKWIWMDVTYGIIGVTDVRGHYLDAAQLCLALADEYYKKTLVVHYLKNGKIRKTRFEKFPQQSALINYFGRGQDIFFYHKEKYPITFPQRKKC